MAGCFSDRHLVPGGTLTTGESSSTAAPTSSTGEEPTSSSSSSSSEAGSSSTTQGPTELIVAVADGENDALQDPDGSVKVAFGWTTLNSPNHWGAMRFAVPDVPRGAKIVAAEFVVYCDGVDTDSPRAEIYGELAPNPPVFTATSGDISGRPRTKASVLWTADDVGAGWTHSPSLVSVIQELVDQEGWAPNQHMVLILDATPEASNPIPFEYRQWDFAANFAPKLGIQYLE